MVLIDCKDMAFGEYLKKKKVDTEENDKEEQTC